MNQLTSQTTNQPDNKPANKQALILHVLARDMSGVRYEYKYSLTFGLFVNFCFIVLLQALNKLDQIEVQLNNMDLPRNSAELAEQHSQLSNAIVDVSTEAIHEGRLLLERVSSVDPGADGVRRKVNQFIFTYLY